MSLPAIQARRVLDVRRHTGGVVETFFEADELAASVLPGQFVMLRVPGGYDPLLPRPMSVFRRLTLEGAPAASVLYTVTGAGTARLACLGPGQELMVLGPLGRPFELVSPPQGALLVAGGIGIAGLMLLAEALSARGVATTLAYGARSAQDLVALERFEALGIATELATDDGSRGLKGLVTELLLKLWSDGRAADARVYACGPQPMLRAVRALVLERGVQAELALEAHMACGFGICLGCAVASLRRPGRYELVCKDGPVFPAEAVLP